jgi:hypothetical protein
MALNNAINSATPNIAAHAIVLSQGASPNTGVTLTNNQVLIGVTGADPVAGNLPGLTSWVDQTSTPVTVAVNVGYIINNGGVQVVATLPAVFAIGDRIRIVGQSAGGWQLLPGAGDSIQFGNVNAATSLTSSNQYDSIELVGIVANTLWSVVTAVGNITYV